MHMERTLVGLAVICALVLLVAPFTPRTRLDKETAPGALRGGGMRHSAGWDYVAPARGLVALVGLGVAGFVHPRVVVPIVGAVVAAGAFGVTAVASGGHWIDAISGALDIPGYATVPAKGAPAFVVVAIVGAAYSAALALGWAASRERNPGGKRARVLLGPHRRTWRDRPAGCSGRVVGEDPVSGARRWRRPHRHHSPVGRPAPSTPVRGMGRRPAEAPSGRACRWRDRRWARENASRSQWATRRGAATWRG